MINVVCNVRNGILVVQTYTRRGSFGSLEDDLRHYRGNRLATLRDILARIFGSSGRELCPMPVRPLVHRQVGVPFFKKQTIVPRPILALSSPA
jgi:hypothetical protein